MMISTKGRYALRVMLDICENGKDGCVSLSEVAKRQEISPKYLEAIVARLCRAGLIESRRGKSGGYRLSKPAEEYNLLEIIEATEGGLVPVNCACITEDGRCEKSGLCPTAPVWKKLDEIICDYLRGVTLCELLEKPTEKS